MLMDGLGEAGVNSGVSTKIYQEIGRRGREEMGTEDIACTKREAL